MKLEDYQVLVESLVREDGGGESESMEVIKEKLLVAIKDMLVANKDLLEKVSTLRNDAIGMTINVNNATSNCGDDDDCQSIASSSSTQFFSCDSVISDGIHENVPATVPGRKRKRDLNLQAGLDALVEMHMSAEETNKVLVEIHNDFVKRSEHCVKEVMTKFLSCDSFSSNGDMDDPATVPSPNMPARKQQDPILQRFLESSVKTHKASVGMIKRFVETYNECVKVLVQGYSDIFMASMDGKKEVMKVYLHEKGQYRGGVMNGEDLDPILQAGLDALVEVQKDAYETEKSLVHSQKGIAESSTESHKVTADCVKDIMKGYLECKYCEEKEN